MPTPNVPVELMNLPTQALVNDIEALMKERVGRGEVSVADCVMAASFVAERGLNHLDDLWVDAPGSTGE